MNIRNAAMQPRVYHGELTPNEVAQALVAQFHRGNLLARQFGDKDKVIVQVASHPQSISGGQTAITVILQKVEDGLSVQVGKQAWLGVAASLGTSVLSFWRSPFNLLGRLDDIAQDIENLQLSEDIWKAIDNIANLKGATFELSERLRRIVCEYCNTANPVGEPSCVACGAPLGGTQPSTCKNCGFVINRGEIVCPNCGQLL
jgi:DNA-directed RNA polymerase subunit RPC12/RpoP